VRNPETRWEVNETSGWQVRVHGDMAIVVAVLHQKGVSDSKAFDSNVKFSDTYIREDGRWRNVHAHASKAVDVPTPWRVKARSMSRVASVTGVRPVAPAVR
jgi:hypothetical protein